MATKEVKVKSYTRKTKSGKSVIVRAHTAKHKCSDKGCGSGEELLKRKSKKFEVLGVDMSKLSDADFKDFAGQHYAYDDDDNLVWAPSTRSGFKKFMEKHYGYDSEASSNFKEGFNEYVSNLTANKVQKKNARKMSGVYRANAALAESTGHSKAAEGFRAKAKKESAKLKSLKKK